MRPGCGDTHGCHRFSVISAQSIDEIGGLAAVNSRIAMAGSIGALNAVVGMRHGLFFLGLTHLLGIARSKERKASVIMTPLRTGEYAWTRRICRD